jgi:hypothetical protein
MADRYAYLSLIGIFVVVCWGVAELAKRVGNLPNGRVRGWRCCRRADDLELPLHRQLSFWNDNVTLWSHTLAITGNNFIAEENLAMALISEGRASAGVAAFSAGALTMRPGDPLATINIATYDQMLGHYQAALDGYAMVIQSQHCRLFPASDRACQQRICPPLAETI